METNRFKPLGDYLPLMLVECVNWQTLETHIDQFFKNTNYGHDFKYKDKMHLTKTCVTYIYESYPYHEKKITIWFNCFDGGRFSFSVFRHHLIYKIAWSIPFTNAQELNFRLVQVLQFLYSKPFRKRLKSTKAWLAEWQNLH